MLRRLLTAIQGRKSRSAADALPLRGTPAIRRLKTYQSDTGFTWSYCYEGYRDRQAPEAARGYEFTLFGGNRNPVRVVVLLTEAVIRELAAPVGREISSRESYALAKMHLFSLLDREVDPAAASPTRVDIESALHTWSALDL